MIIMHEMFGPQCSAEVIYSEEDGVFTAVECSISHAKRKGAMIIPGEWVADAATTKEALCDQVASTLNGARVALRPSEILQASHEK